MFCIALCQCHRQQKPHSVRHYVIVVLLLHAQTAELRWQHGIEVKGENCPPPFEQFSQLELQPDLVALMTELHYTVSHFGPIYHTMYMQYHWTLLHHIMYQVLMSTAKCFVALISSCIYESYLFKTVEYHSAKFLRSTIFAVFTDSNWKFTQFWYTLTYAQA